jgi:carboxypeptidase C (cathepsin A)
MKPARRAALPFLLAAAAAIAQAAAAAQAAQAATWAPLASGDEAIVVTRHRVETARGVLEYETRAGRLAIRRDDNGEVRAHVFFVAYVMPGKAKQPRPLTFAWNGGPSVPAVLLHTELLAPWRLEGGAFVVNDDTLLWESDLVFVDPVGTGFSRPAAPAFEDEFYGTLGDFAATAEFIRAWRARFGAERQPLYLLGESYGTWRAGGTAEILASRGTPVAGAILISGGVPGSQMPFAFMDAWAIPARTAAAFAHGRLEPELLRDRARTMEAVAAWIAGQYLPALERIGELGDAGREAIARDLARYTGLAPGQIDRQTLVMGNRAYLAAFNGGDPAKTLNMFDMRIAGATPPDPGRRDAILDYLRGAIGYRTDLAYDGLEEGYLPASGPARRSIGSRWAYNHVEITPEVMARAMAGGGPPASQPWLQNAMRADPGLRVFVAAGRYDALNLCEGNPLMTQKLEGGLARRFTHRCYEGGHMMYRDVPERQRLLRDLARFVAAR